MRLHPEVWTLLEAQLPALQVILPLSVAPLCVLLRHSGAAFVVATAATLSSFVVALGLYWQLPTDGGVISYALGSWLAPWGIEYRVDRLTSFMLLLISGMASIIMLWSRDSIRREIPLELHYLFYAMYLLCLAGLLGITMTGDAFNLFVFLEISSLSSYVLIAMGRNRRSLAAAFRYLIMGSIGATLIVIGIGFLYLVTGTLNLADMAPRLEHQSRAQFAALAFISVGVSLKLALFPLHQWLPNAYTYAPSAVSALLAATATKVSAYVLIRFYYSVFGEYFIFEQLSLGLVLLLLSLLAMFLANFTAIFQDNLKRLFAWSSIGQIGYITLGLSLASPLGLAASIVHLFNHAIAKAAIFMLIGGALGKMSTRDDEPPVPTLDRLSGLSRRMPLTSFGIVVAGLSLIGVPGTAGFISKWLLVSAAMEQEYYWLVAAVVGSSLMAVAYVWRFIEVAYFRPPPSNSARGEAPPMMLTMVWLLIIACIYFGLDTRYSVDSATAAALQLMRMAG